MNTIVSPFLREKAKTSKNIFLTENNKLVIEEEKIWEILNTYFTNVTEGLNLQVVQKDRSFENEASYRLIKYHYLK